jgi:phage shock protein PspC (stress-responsive transcriptional regulator)
MTTQIMRSMTNKRLGGVAGGIAAAFGWDVTLVRLGFVLLALAHGSGVLLYLVLWLVLPQAEQPSLAAQAVAGARAYTMPTTDRNRTLGYVLLGVGAFLLASMLEITGPVIALLILAAGWYLRKR